MPRLRSVRSGAVVSCSEETTALLGSEWQPFDGTIPADADGDDKGYEAWTAKELKVEIAKRNVDREDDAQLSDKGNKPALIEVLERDDAAQASSGAAAVPDDAPSDDAPEDEGDQPDSDES